eukprot:93293-Rhodomonas_salina.1
MSTTDVGGSTTGRMRISLRQPLCSAQVCYTLSYRPTRLLCDARYCAVPGTHYMLCDARFCVTLHAHYMLCDAVV